MSEKPVRVAGVITLLMCTYDMERETTQTCMPEGVLLGALVTPMLLLRTRMLKKLTTP